MAIGAQGLWNIEWLNQNSQRKYPLHEDASLQDTSGSITLPTDFLVDIILPVHVDPTIDTTKFHVLNVSVFGAGVTLSLGYEGALIGSITIDVASFTRNKSYLLQGTTPFFDSTARIVIGSLDNILKLAGSYTFSESSGQLENTVVVPDIRGVTAIQLKNGDDTSDPIQGDVVLQAGRNMFLSFVAGDGSPSNPSRIIFNAISGEGLNTNCDCNEARALPCIKTINGIPPTVLGDFSLLESDCIKLEEISNGLRLNDDCSEPCCGCDELSTVQATAERIQLQINSLANLASRLETAVGTMEFNLLKGNL